MKRVVVFSAIVLSTAMLAILVGCGGNASSRAQPTLSITTTPTTTPAPPTPHQASTHFFAFLRSEGTATGGTPQQLQAARRATKTAHATGRQAAITSDPAPVSIYVWPFSDQGNGWWPGTERKISGSAGGYTSVHLSPNDTHIAFSKIVNGYNQIFTSTVPAEGQTMGEPIQLTADMEHHWVPHIATDGSKVVFTKFDANSNGDVVCVINNAAGATETCLDFSSTTPVLKGTNIWHASWAPNDTIFFEAWAGPLISDDIFVVKADGSGLTRITNNAGTNNYDECPSVSSDGKWIAVGTWNDTMQYYEIATIDLNTKQRLTEISGKYDPGVSWDPLATYYTIVWVSQLANDQSLQIYASGFGPMRISNNGYANYFESSPR